MPFGSHASAYYLSICNHRNLRCNALILNSNVAICTYETSFVYTNRFKITIAVRVRKLAILRACGAEAVVPRPVSSLDTPPSASGVISQKESEITYIVLFSMLEARLGLGLVLAYPYLWPIARIIVTQVLRGSLKTIVQCIFASRVIYPYSYASHPTTQTLFSIANSCV